MSVISLTNNHLNKEGYFYTPIDIVVNPADVALFDQNGYDLSTVEQYYAKANGYSFVFHRPSHIAIRYDWFQQPQTYVGAMINHCNLFERKGYRGEALDQIKGLCGLYPVFWKVAKIRPKWGLDFSIDYCDNEGNVFEILHWEWDTFSYDEHIDKKVKYEGYFESIDWNDAGKQLLKCKDKWFNLNFFEQSQWKCDYFGVEKENFKMVLWE